MKLTVIVAVAALASAPSPGAMARDPSPVDAPVALATTSAGDAILGTWWSEGSYCYNPRDGKTYRVKFKLLSATRLHLRGYLAVPLLGQSQEWTRAA